MLRMFSGMNGLGGSLLVVIVLMALVFAASRFDFILTSGKSKDGDLEGEDDSTYAFYASKRRRASSKLLSMLSTCHPLTTSKGVKRVTFDI
ncbi:hypothetical protein CABS03_03885 [Colletotrichum abscissum]